MREIRATGLGTEETSFYSALEALINEVGGQLSIPVRAVSQLSNTGAGSPDYGFVSAASGDLLGVVEAKPTSDDSLRTAKGEQVSRYYEHYGVVLVTNYRDFVLVTRDASNEAAVEMRYSIEPDEASFWSRPIRGLVAQREERFSDFLVNVLTRGSPVRGANDVAEALARYGREALVRLEAL